MVGPQGSKGTPCASSPAENYLKAKYNGLSYVKLKHQFRNDVRMGATFQD